eukprot:5807868-Amphidinium_carterae.1
MLVFGKTSQLTALSKYHAIRVAVMGDLNSRVLGLEGTAPYIGSYASACPHGCENSKLLIDVLTQHRLFFSDTFFSGDESFRAEALTSDSHP